MKTYIIETTDTYPNVVLMVETNSLGDQLLTLMRENIEGTRTIISMKTLVEGEHLTETEFKQWAKEKLNELTHFESLVGV